MRGAKRGGPGRLLGRRHADSCCHRRQGRVGRQAEGVRARGSSPSIHVPSRGARRSCACYRAHRGRSLAHRCTGPVRCGPGWITRDVPCKGQPVIPSTCGRGYGEGYRPQVAQDDRPFFQRLFTSPESQSSPTPYAIGPIRMNQAIPALGPMGLLMRFMSGGREQEQDPRVTRAISDLQDKSKWMAGYGSEGGRVSVEQDLPTVSPKDYSVYGNIDFPMYIPQAELATGPEYSGRYPQAAYEAGFDDIYLDSLKSRDPENFAFVMRNYGVEGY